MDYGITEFACARCGNCCRGEGYVRITPDDAVRIAELLEMSVGDFVARYARTPDDVEQARAGDVWLVDKPGPEMECIFLEGNGCRIHAAKPVQCVGFPLRWRTPDIMEYCVGMQGE